MAKCHPHVYSIIPNETTKIIIKHTATIIVRIVNIIIFAENHNIIRIMKPQDFTNLYKLTKTLRFELKPQEKTQEQLGKWLNEENTDERNLILKDKKIAKAYITIKSILDRLHEECITKSLSSATAKQIDFSKYLSLYRTKEEIGNEEKNLRKKIGESFNEGKEFFSQELSKLKTKNKKDKKNKKYHLTDNIVLEYIYKNSEKLSSADISVKEIKECIEHFTGFFTYLKEYNENRNNYYDYNNEKSTSIATRIVHENLPKFCDNVITFDARKEEYINIKEWLNSQGRITQIKNATTNEFEEALTIDENTFSIKHFNNCLTQDEIDEYNRIIGNYNSIINLYNQAKKQEDKSFHKLDEFTTLYKQIGCGKRKTFITILKDKDNELSEQLRQGKDILTVESLLRNIKNASETYFKGDKSTDKTTILQFVKFLRECSDWRGIYWSKNATNAISSQLFYNRDYIKELLKENKACATYDAKREEPLQLREAIELSELFSVLDKEDSNFIFKKQLIEEGHIKVNDSPSKNIINILCKSIEDNILKFITETDKIVALEKYRQENYDGNDDPIITKIKNWLDLSIEIMSTVRYFSVRRSKMKGNIANPKMEKMLSDLLHNSDADWFTWYDLMRNYLTKKPQDDAKERKIKLNFGKANLLNGFVDSNTITDNGTQYGGYLFRKMHPSNEGYEYFLGISKNAKLFRCHLKDSIKESDKSEYERLEYYQMKDTTPYPSEYKEKKERIREIIKELVKNNSSKDLSNDISKIIDKAEKKDTTPTQLFSLIRENEKLCYILEDKQLLDEVNETIKLITENCLTFTRIEALTECAQKSYTGCEGLDELIKDLNNDITKTRFFSFFNVSNKEFNEHNGKDLFLFKISNKDLSYYETHSKGLRKQKTDQNENLHTLYFRALMRENGFDDTIDLGSGEIFLREKAFTYNEDILAKGHHSKELKNKFNYPIISKKRFANDKYLLHLSITLNYKSPESKITKFNERVNTLLQENQEINIIGIDRGEKHLVYSCVIDTESNIIKCQHHDVIHNTDYVQKLDEIADKRTSQRKNWQQQSNIKNLKDGYISHVVHQLTELTIKDKSAAINPHAYIVFEDLNSEMKRSRERVEKQTYQKIETALAKKFNYIVDKRSRNNELASVSKALQLTPPLNNYDDIKNNKQFGVMLYTRANYTSITDPATGWRQTIYIKNGNDKSIKEQILKEFTDFGFDGKDYYFEYKEKHTGKVWRLYSGKGGAPIPRYRNSNNGNIWAPEPVNVVVILKHIFANFNNSISFKKQIDNGIELQKTVERNETGWQSLRYVIGLIQQIRNTGKEIENQNFLHSPVRTADGRHFDTREAANNGTLSQIVDADANGAYNIARKGLIMNEHIKYCLEHNIKYENVNLYITDEEWDIWLLNRELWRERISNYAVKK